MGHIYVTAVFNLFFNLSSRYHNRNDDMQIESVIIVACSAKNPLIKENVPRGKLKVWIVRAVLD
jgi:hypothetical protein